MSTTTSAALAIDGGKPELSAPLPPPLQGVLDIGQPEIDAVTTALKRQTLFRFLNDNAVSESARLEAEFRKRLGVSHALALSGGGTGALICALVGLGVGSGDEVLVPGYTYIATAAACLVVGAIPILVEVDETLTIDVADAKRKITPYTRAIIPVHMRGAIADMTGVMALAAEHNLKVLEDCAQANGGIHHGKPVGSIGHAGAFSMQHYKVVTAGEGGIVSTNDPQVFRRAAMRHDSAMQFWRASEQWETFAGENYRMCEIRAALGLTQMTRIDAILARCRAIKATLRQATSQIAALRVQPSHDAAGDVGITHVFFCRTADAAQKFSTALAAEGVRNATIYNKEIPDRHIYNAWDYVMEKRTHDHTGWPWTAAHRPIEYSAGMLPATLDVLGRCIAIGISHHWTDDQAAAVGRAIVKVGHALAARGQV